MYPSTVFGVARLEKRHDAEALIRVLNDAPNPVLRSRAANGLGNLGVAEEAEQLERAAEHDKSAVVRSNAAGALRRVDPDHVPCPTPVVARWVVVLPTFAPLGALGLLMLVTRGSTPLVAAYLSVAVVFFAAFTVNESWGSGLAVAQPPLSWRSSLSRSWSRPLATCWIVGASTALTRRSPAGWPGDGCQRGGPDLTCMDRA